MPPATLLIVDEAHRKSRFLADTTLSGTRWIALSATPWAKGLGRLWDDLIVPTTMQQLIDEGYLSPFQVFAPSRPDLAGVRKQANDFHEGDLGAAMNKPDLEADVVDTWLRLYGRVSTLVFAVDRAHAKHLQQRFDAAGVPAGYVDAYTDPLERRLIQRQLADGSIRVVVNVG